VLKLNSSEVETFAGSGPTQRGLTNAQGKEARFNYPVGVALDTNGVVYIGDSGNHAIRKISPNGTVTTFAGNGNAGYTDSVGELAQFHLPYGVAVDRSFTVYVLDFGNRRIRKIDAFGNVTTFAGNGVNVFVNGMGTLSSFNRPVGICVNYDGIIYVADQNNHQIRMITPFGNVTTLAGSTYGYADGVGSVAKFRSPDGVAADANGTLYIADYNNFRVRRIV
jgi:sugar lactone lactonase YvrE